MTRAVITRHWTVRWEDVDVARAVTFGTLTEAAEHYATVRADENTILSSLWESTLLETSQP